MALGLHDIRAIIRASKNDGGVIQGILTTERNALVLEIIQNPEAGKEIISGSGNGVSMNASISYTKADRMQFIDRTLKFLEDGTWPSSTAWARFGGGYGVQS